MRWSSALLALFALGACHAVTPPGQLEVGRAYSGSATVRYVPLEGGCWALDTDQYGRVQPMSLDTAYKHDGLRVNVVLTIRTDYASICMIGPMADVQQIRLMESR